MGVQNLWKALSKGEAVEVLDGSQPGHHARIIEAVENKVVAVDLSAWLMQAQTQPALQEHYTSDFARAVKVVFDRTIHWLRYGCLPVFVVEGRTPQAKLAKLRARCVAQYGPGATTSGNIQGSMFDRIGQAVVRMLEAMGVPCVQAVGEGEAMCAALNLCGWAHAVQTADVDALLFGALTVYRQLHLQTDDPKRTTLTRCCMYDVRRVLGINRGGDAALMAVAHLAGTDYSMGGADNVGEVLALNAVRQLLAGCEDDDDVLQRLEAAVAAGPDPQLDALTKCTGCKSCGHEGGRKGRVNTHSATNPCAACGCEDGCRPRDWVQCECAFHARADERLLNRVVARASSTPSFMTGFRTAAEAFAEQTRLAIASVQREFGLPVPGSSSNVFTWKHRPDVRAVSDIMCGYIDTWDYRQVRLKLLPLLLEWDMRQGPSPCPLVRQVVQFRPSSIRKVSSKGAAAADVAGVPLRQQQGWRYVLLVERLPDASAAATAALQHQQGSQQGPDIGKETRQEGLPTLQHTRANAGAETEGDLAIDLSWLAGTARSRPPKQTHVATLLGSPAPARHGTLPQQLQSAPLDSVDGAECAADDYEAEPCLATQVPQTPGGPKSPSVPLRPAGSIQEHQQISSQRGNPTAGGGGSGGSSGGGSLQFAEHRSVRCSLVDAAWPKLTAAFRQPAVSGGRARSGGAGKKNSKQQATLASASSSDKQRTVKDFFGVSKNYVAPGRQASQTHAEEGSSIPGLAGLSSAGQRTLGTSAVTAAAAANNRVAPMPQPEPVACEQLKARSAANPKAAAAADRGTPSRHTTQSFTEWLSQQQMCGSSKPAGDKKYAAQKQTVAAQATRASSKAGTSAAAVYGAASNNGGASGSGRARKKQVAAARTVCKAGPMDRFLQPAAGASDCCQADGCGHTQQQLHQQVEGTAEQQQPACTVGDQSESPGVPPLAARLAAYAAQMPTVGTPRSSSYDRHHSSPHGSDGISLKQPCSSAAASLEHTAPQSLDQPPAKKASTPTTKALRSSPLRGSAAAAAAVAIAVAQSTPQQQLPSAAAVSAAVGNSSPLPAADYNPHYLDLLQHMGVATPCSASFGGPEAVRSHVNSTPDTNAVKRLFASQVDRQDWVQLSQSCQQPVLLQTDQPPHSLHMELIELLDSPVPAAGASTNIVPIDLT